MRSVVGEGTRPRSSARLFGIGVVGLVLHLMPGPLGAQELFPLDVPCSEHVESLVGHPAHLPRAGLRDSIEIISYGTGKRQKIVVPHATDDSLCLGFSCGKTRKNMFPADDYTHLANEHSGSLLAAGEYLAEILPPDRQGLLVDGEPSFDSGHAGAIVMTSVDGKVPPIVIHSGSRVSGPLSRLPSLVMTAQELDVLLGTMLALRRTDMFGTFSSWDAERAWLGDDNACRPAKFGPFHVQVRTGEAKWSERHFGERFGARVTPVDRTAGQQAAVVSTEQIDRAQLTAGLSPLDYDVRLSWMFSRADKNAAELASVFAGSLSDEQRRTRLMALNDDTRALIVEMTVLLEGLRESVKTEEFQSSSGRWQKTIALMEQTISRMDELSENEVAPVLGAGDKGGVVQSLWLPSSQQAQGNALCRLEPVERALPPIPLSFQTLSGLRRIDLQAKARLWFSPVPGLPGIYRLNASARMEADQLRSLHRAVAQELVDSQPRSCQARTFLRETDQAVSQDGAVHLKANVRQETWWCGWYKYPCGVSLKGTTSCRADVRTRLYSVTTGARQTANTWVQGMTVSLQLEGAPAPYGSPVTFRLDQDPMMRQLMTMTELMPTTAKFMELQGAIWHGTELRGGNNINAALACAIADQLGNHL